MCKILFFLITFFLILFCSGNLWGRETKWHTFSWEKSFLNFEVTNFKIWATSNFEKNTIFALFFFWSPQHYVKLVTSNFFFKKRCFRSKAFHLDCCWNAKRKYTLLNLGFKNSKKNFQKIVKITVSCVRFCFSS